MKTSEEIKQIIAGLGAFQKECPTITKDKQGYGYKYASFDTIVSTVKPILIKHGVIFAQSIGSNQLGMLITTRIMHSSGEWIEDTMMLPATQMKNVNNVQAMGASITYGKRYGLSALLGIAVDEDTDSVIKQNNQGNNNGQ